MSERNQTVAAQTALVNSIDWDKVDLQLIVEAGNRGRLGRPLTIWLAARAWEGVKVVQAPEGSKPVTLKCVDIFDGKSFLEGKEFMRLARLVPGAMNGGTKAFEYYLREGHWNELPDDASVIVFVDTEFDSGDDRCVRCLCRDGPRWCRDFLWVAYRFRSSCRVAVLASPLGSEAKAS